MNLHETFSQSGYGQLLESRTRFDDFKPEWVGTELWCNLLGDDVNNLRHMPYTHQLASRFVCLQELEENQAEDLLTTAITHDWGEAIIGDIPLPSKTSDDEAREVQAYRQIATELFGYTQGLHLSRLVLPILTRKSSELGDMFRSVENVGYSLTGLRASQTALALSNGILDVGATRPQREQLTGGLMAMSKSIEVYTFPLVREYIKKYKGIKTLLEEQLC